MGNEHFGGSRGLKVKLTNTDIMEKWDDNLLSIMLSSL